MSEPLPPPASARNSGRNSGRWIIAGLLALLVLFSAGLRVEKARASGSFDNNPVGSVRSDPGLLYYLADQVIESGGGLPAGAVDRAIEYPEGVSVSERYCLGQEWILLAARSLVGNDVPLHRLALWTMGLIASLTLVGVFGLARELTGSVRWGLAAALLHALSPAAYRSIGFVLVREDLSLPLLAAHLWLAARAWRVRTVGAGVLAGVSMGLTLATWHAAGFLVAMEAGAVLIWFLRSDRCPFDRGDDHRVALGFLLSALVLCLAVPVLRAKGAVLSPGLVPLLALLLAARLGRGRRGRIGIALVGLALLAGASRGLAELLGTGADFDHVLGLMMAKLTHLGQLPDDPAQLPFDVRMMWQGPFATLDLGRARHIFGPTLWALPVLLALSGWRFVRGGSRDMQQVMGLLLALLTVASWLVMRVSAGLAIVLPVMVVAALACTTDRPKRPALPGLAMAALIALQTLTFFTWAADTNLAWHWPLRRERDRALVVAIDQLVPEGEAVAADFMVSTVILAHTAHPILLQPKWESASSRRRVERFWNLLYHSSPADLANALRTEFDTRYLLLDRHTLQWLRSSRYLAGIERDGGDLPPASALAALLAGDRAQSFPGVEGYELIWSDDPVPAFPDGSERDFYRLFRLTSAGANPR